MVILCPLLDWRSRGSGAPAAGARGAQRLDLDLDLDLDLAVTHARLARVLGSRAPSPSPSRCERSGLFALTRDGVQVSGDLLRSSSPPGAPIRTTLEQTMYWTLAAAAFLITYVSLVVAFLRSPAAPATPEAAASKAPPPPPPAPAAPYVRKKSTSIDADDLPLLGDDDEDDITIVTLSPVAPTPRISMPMSAFEEDDEVPDPVPEAVAIVYDQDAAEDEPTRIEQLFLVSAAGQTDTGQRRKKNEDSYVILDDLNLFVVADGMGGHAGGEVASQIAVDVIGAAFKKNRFTGEHYANVPRRGSELAVAVQMANEAIFTRAKNDPDLTGMGTTVVAARFSPNKQRLYLGHVGDSRCYRLRDGDLKQVTTDHTMGASGITGPLADRLERAVGIAPAVKVDVIIGRPLPNDLYLLCSDGLSKMVSIDRMRAVLVAEKDLDQAASKLVAEANAGGGRDNITVILVQVKSPVTLFA